MKYGYLVPHPPLLIPGIGKGDEIPDTKNAYNKIAAQIEIIKPETIVVISPHSILYDDYFHIAPGKNAEGDFRSFGSKQKISVCYDEEFANLLGETARKEGLPAGTQGAIKPELDHGVLVPLHFIKTERIVRVSLSGFSLLDHYRFGMCIKKAGELLGRNYIVLASGDMSHKLKADGPYGFSAEGPKFDKLIFDCLKKEDIRALMSIDSDLYQKAAECGFKSLAMLAGAFDGYKLGVNVLCYEGPFGVGYLTAEFKTDGIKESLMPLLSADRDEKLERIKDKESEYVKLARLSVEHFTRTQKKLKCPDDLLKDLFNKRAGVFVSIKKDGKLRGCIGTTAPTQSGIAEEIIQNAISAAFNDPRFSPVEEQELNSLVYSVDVLSPAEFIKDKKELNVNRYGVIVRFNRKSGLLLPALDGVDTVDEQISIALKKAGISPNEPYTLERFEVVRYK